MSRLQPNECCRTCTIFIASHLSQAKKLLSTVIYGKYNFVTVVSVKLNNLSQLIYFYYFSRRKASVEAKKCL